MARENSHLNAERVVFFTDAVVAIAQTLLILPLMESVAEASAHRLSTYEWVREHSSQVWSFLLSFILISGFWLNHHRIFHRVERTDVVVRALNIVWMLTIVVLPVVTALVGGLETDRLQSTLYVGTMMATAAVTGAIAWWIDRHPELMGDDGEPVRRSMVGSFATAIFMGLALVLALVFPSLGLGSLFILFLIGPSIRLFHRVTGRGPAAE